MEHIQFLFALYQTYIKREQAKQLIKQEKKSKGRKTKPKKIAKGTLIQTRKLKDPLEYIRTFQIVTEHLANLKDKVQKATKAIVFPKEEWPDVKRYYTLTSPGVYLQIRYKKFILDKVRKYKLV